MKLRLGARRDAEAYHAKQRMLVLDAMQRLVVDAHVGLRLRRVRGHRRGRSGSLVSKQLRRVTVTLGTPEFLRSLMCCSSGVCPTKLDTLKVWRGEARGRREEANDLLLGVARAPLKHPLKGGKKIGTIHHHGNRKSARQIYLPTYLGRKSSYASQKGRK